MLNRTHFLTTMQLNQTKILNLDFKKKKSMKIIKCLDIHGNKNTTYENVGYIANKALNAYNKKGKNVKNSELPT